MPSPVPAPRSFVLWSVLAAAFVLAPASPAGAEILWGPLFNPATGHHYYAASGSSWMDLEAQAVARGGHLVAINDAAEQAWIETYFSGMDGMAIGISDSATEGLWAWTTGEPVTYTNWAAGAPGSDGDLDFGKLTYPGGKWGDTGSGGAGTRGILEIAPTDVLRPVRQWSVNGHWYLAISGTTWVGLESRAHEYGGHLVAINDLAEQEWLKSQFSSLGVAAIGLVDADREGTWTWTSGEPVTYTNWATSQPDNWYYTKRGWSGSFDEDYGEIRFDWGATWNDFYNVQTVGIVEIAPPAGALLLGPIVNPANGHSYSLVHGCWNDVYDFAQATGGHLVAIGDAAENNWIRATFGSYGRSWIGLNDLWVEGAWEWTCDEPLTFTNWRPGEPNEGGTTVVGWYNAGAIWGGKKPVFGLRNEDFACIAADGYWEDVLDGVTQGIVEYPNTAPVADASASQTLGISLNRRDATVVLDASRSTDREGDPLTCTWLLDGTVIATGMVAAAAIPMGTSSVELQVSDGLLTSTTHVTIEVIFINHPPTADAGATPREVISYNRVDAEVTLDGSRSSDPDPVDTLAAEWWVDGRVVANAMVTTVTLAVGTHDVQLVVRDPDVAASDSFTITVIPYNTAPVALADATASQVISRDNVAATVLLDGTHSYDAEADPFLLLWSVDGVPVGEGPTVSVEMSVGVHLVELIAEDWRDASSTSVYVEVITGAAASGQVGDAVAAADIPGGVEGSLLSSLEAASASFDSGSIGAGVNQLQAFQNKVRAQAGKKISQADADRLLALAQQIIEAMEEP